MTERRNVRSSEHFAFGRASDHARLGALSPRRNAVQTRSRETVDVILEAAAQVFSLEGFAAATTEGIAARAGVSVGSLYQYWSNKEAIAVALMERHGETAVLRLIPVLKQIGDTTIPVELRIESLVRAIVDPDEDADLHWTLEAEAGVPPLYRGRIAELSAGFARHLESALDLQADAALVVACALEALPHALLRPATRLGPEKQARELARLIVAYVSASRST